MSMAATLRQLVTFVVDKVVEGDLRLLFTNALGSITLPDGTTRSLGPVARNALAIFEDLCLLENGENAQYLRLEYLRIIFSVERSRVCSRTITSPPQGACLFQLMYVLVVLIAIIDQVSQTLALSTIPSPHCSERSLSTLFFRSCFAAHV